MTIIWFRNEVWGAELLNQLIWTDARAVGTEIDNPSISGIAEAFGAVGVTVDGSEENFKIIIKLLDYFLQDNWDQKCNKKESYNMMKSYISWLSIY